MKTALLSIHEQYAAKIFAGTKRFEFRRRAPEMDTPIRFLVYVPGRRRLAGEMRVNKILEGRPSTIWRKTRAKAGITKKEFDAYFDGRDVAYAYAIGRVKEYDEQPTLGELRQVIPGGFYPPQYLRWVNPSYLAAVEQVAG